MMKHRTRLLYAGLLCALIGLSACASTTPQPEPPGNLDEIIGVWRLPDTGNVVKLAACSDAPTLLCGVLVAFEGDVGARDYSHPDALSWGERLCGAQVLHPAQFDPDARLWTGEIYVRAEGSIYQAELSQTGPDTLNVFIFDGASLEEGVSMALGAALGSPPDPFDLTYYSLRAALGREALSQTQTWVRAEAPVLDRCAP